MMNILKMKAKDAINSTIAKGSANRAQILAGVKRVYRSTREGDELRELFVSWAAGCRQGMAKDEVAKRELEAVFGEVPRFAVDLFLRGGGQHRA